MKTKLLNFLIVLFLSLATFSSCSNEDFLDERSNSTKISNSTIIIDEPNGENYWDAVVLTSVGPNRLAVLLVITKFLKCNLMVAIELVNSVPETLAIARHTTALEFKTELEEAGATVELQ